MTFRVLFSCRPGVRVSPLAFGIKETVRLPTPIARYESVHFVVTFWGVWRPRRLCSRRPVFKPARNPGRPRESHTFAVTRRMGACFAGVDLHRGCGRRREPPFRKLRSEARTHRSARSSRCTRNNEHIGLSFAAHKLASTPTTLQTPDLMRSILR